jgi:methionine biosynthesis protein MetW
MDRPPAWKRVALDAYFSALELRAAARGLFARPKPAHLANDYEAYWRDRAPGGLQPRFILLGDQLPDGASLLDVGCGDGAMLAYLVERKKIRGLGIDVSATAVEAAGRRGVEARVETLQEIAARAGEGAFEHVVMSEVIEHVAEPEAWVKLGMSLARDALWLTFPNIGYFPHRARLAAGRFPVQWVVFPGEHLRFWTVSDFGDWLAALGFPNAHYFPSNGIVLGGLHRRWPNLLANQILVRIDKR